MNIRLLVCFFSLLLTIACSSGNRKPASLMQYGPSDSKVVIRELEPYLITQNHPEHSILINPNAGIEIQTDYFSKHLGIATTSKSAMNSRNPLHLDAMISCDAPFEFREELNKMRHPGPSQVRFQLSDLSYRLPAPVLFPSSEVSECRLFVKLPEQPKVVYGVRLVTQPDPVE